MSATQEELALRLAQLERSLEELTTTLPRSAQPAFDLAEAISFRAWMRISAPTFALMAMGFAVLWNAQQAHSAQLYEMSRSLGRLDGAIDRFDERLLGIDERLLGIDERLGAFDVRLEKLDQTLQSLSIAVEKLSARD